MKKRIIVMGLILTIILCSCKKEMVYQEEFRSYPDLTYEELHNEAMFIVVATYTGEKEQINPKKDNEKPVTDHVMKVERIIKGPKCETFKLRMNYGVYKNISYSTNLDIEMVKGRKYLLYLTRNINDEEFCYKLFSPFGYAVIDENNEPKVEKQDEQFKNRLYDIYNGVPPKNGQSICIDYAMLSLEQNLQKSDTIVTGYFTGEYSSTDTKTVRLPFIVEKVLKGDVQGKEIRISDYIQSKSDGIVDVNAINQGNKYLMFLTKSDDGSYHQNQPSKHKIDGDSIDTSFNDYKEYYEKFIKKIDA